MSGEGVNLRLRPPDLDSDDSEDEDEIQSTPPATTITCGEILGGLKIL